MPQQSQAQQGYVQYPAAAPAQYVYYSQQAFGWVPNPINNEIAWFQKYISEEIFFSRVLRWDC